MPARTRSIANEVRVCVRAKLDLHRRDSAADTSKLRFTRRREQGWRGQARAALPQDRRALSLFRSKGSYTQYVPVRTVSDK